MTKKATAHLNYLKVSPRKARLIADIIRGLSLQEAEAQLMLSPRRASVHFLKLLRSAAADARHNFSMDVDKLYVEEIRVDQGPRLKRWMPRARGAMSLREKKMSHATVILGEREQTKQPRFVMPVKVEKKPETKKEKKTNKGEKEHKGEEQDKSYELKQDVKPESKPKQPGVIQKIFRRKSI